MISEKIFGISLFLNFICENPFKPLSSPEWSGQAVLLSFMAKMCPYDKLILGITPMETNAHLIGILSFGLCICGFLFLQTVNQLPFLVRLLVVSKPKPIFAKRIFTDEIFFTNSPFLQHGNC